MDRRKKYRKSKRQKEKEKTRRDKVFEMLVQLRWVKEREMSARLGVSRSTIQRDKKKLRRRVKRYFADLERQSEMKRQEERAHRLKEIHKLNGLSDYQQYKALVKLMLGKYPTKGRPRGKPFTSEYQPRWNKRENR
jgi:predicted DNA-binding transcriptional regulator AlpA